MKSKVLAARVAELERTIADYGKLIDDACDAGQFGPAITARHKCALAESELADLRAAIEGMALADPIDRLRHDHARASAAGSWVAVAQINGQIKAAEAVRAAELAAEEERRRKDKTPEAKARQLREVLIRMPQPLRQMVLRGLDTDTDTNVH